MTNRLAAETSLYLKQHAENPVDWFPWGEAAFAKAKAENKPVLLSIGYSSCHWCHVMAHESFEDKETANVMNRLFINIKVDREERPDIDDIYQTTHQLLNMSAGGWPLTVFLCPETKTPFFSGTYFPKNANYGRPAFKDVLTQLAQFYQENREKILQHADDFKQHLKNLLPTQTDSTISLNKNLFPAAIQQLLKQIDWQHGGFGHAPKFPMPSFLAYFINYCAYPMTDSDLLQKARKALSLTLDKMTNGGIWDHVGGGFFRYSTDATWEIPHFEKMLYDNAQLLGIYSDATTIFSDKKYKEIVDAIIHWLETEMRDDRGGFFAAIDADTNGVEGLYYLWTVDEIKNLLSSDEFKRCKKYFNLEHSPNFEGKWHLFVANPEIDEANIKFIHEISAKLYQARTKRSKPTTDPKIICSWNALTAKNLLKAGFRFTHSHYLQLGQQCLDFIRENLWVNSQLFATFQEKAKHPAYLDDYAFLIDALYHSLAAKWRDQDYKFMLELCDTVINNFYDAVCGGFFFTAHQHESMIHRAKPLQDGVTPSGNGVAALALLRIGHLTGNADYLAKSQQTLQLTTPSITDRPEHYYHLTATLAENIDPPSQMIVVGPEQLLTDWRETIKPHLSAKDFIFFIPSSSQQHPPFIELKSSETMVHAYICHGTHCEKPITDLESLLEKFKKIPQHNP